MSKFPLTVHGAEMLRAELQQLKTKELRALSLPLLKHALMRPDALDVL